MDKNLTEGSPAKLIFFFALPLIIGNLFQQLYNVADTLIVGRTIGADALAAVGCCGSILFLIVGFMAACTSGFSIITAQFYGAKDYVRVRKNFCATIVLGLAISVILTVICSIYTREILMIMQTPKEILDSAYIYAFILFVGAPSFILYNLLANTIMALGDSKTPLYFLLIATVLNIVLDLVFILSFKMGVKGAALATITSQTVATLLCTYEIFRRFPILRLHKEDWKLGWKDLYRPAKLGLSMGFQTSIIAVGCVIVQMAVNTLGADPMAACSIAQRVECVALLPMMSFGLAMATYTGQNYGAGKFQRIRQGVRQCSVISLSMSLIIALILLQFGTQIATLFVGSEELKVIALTQVYLNLTASLYWILAMLFIFRYTLQGLGHTFVPTFAGVMELVMRVAAVCFLVNWMGFGGAVLSHPLAWLGSCVPLCVAYFYYMAKLQAKRS